MKLSKLNKAGTLRRYMQLPEDGTGGFTKAKDSLSISTAAASVKALNKAVYSVKLKAEPSLRGRRKLLMESNPDLALIGSVSHLTLLSEEDVVELLIRSAGAGVEEAVLALPWVVRFSLVEVTP